MMPFRVTRVARALVAPLALLALAAPALAFETADGRFQLHGFYQMQLRGISSGWAEQFDMTQWYNILNLEFELDLAPDGFEPFFDSASAYVRAEVRFDCIYYDGCGMVSSMNTYGNDSEGLPERLSGARRLLSAGALPVERTETDYFSAPPNQPDGGETVPRTDITVNDSEIIPSHDPVPIGEAPPFSLFADVAGLDRYRGPGPTLPEFNQYGPDLGENLLLVDDPYPHIFDSNLASIHMTAINGRGGGGFGLPVSTLLPWRPKDWSDANSLLSNKTNPFDNTRVSAQLQAANYNRQMFREVSCLLNPEFGTTCLPDGQYIPDPAGGLPLYLPPNSQLDAYIPGDMEISGPDAEATWFNNKLLEGLAGKPFQALYLQQAKDNAQIAFEGKPYGPNPVFVIDPVLASPKGFGANPLRPIPCLASTPGGSERCIPVGTNRSATGDNAAQGLFVPSKPLRNALDGGRIDPENYREMFKFDQLDRAFNHGWSQSRTYELKEAYLDLETFDSRLWMRIGKQTIVWGKTELFRTTDQFNPQDLSLASLPSLEESRIPLLAFRGVYSLYDVGPLEDVRVEVAIQLDEFQGTDAGTCGEPYAPDIVCTLGVGALGHGTSGIGVAGVDLPPSPWDDIKGLQGGARLEFRYDRFSFAFSDYYGYSAFPYIHLLTEYDRNVDLDSGRMRIQGADGPCIYGTEDACLQPGPITFGSPDPLIDLEIKTRNAALLLDARNALEAHPVNQQFFALACASTTGISSLDSAACATNIFSSEATTQGIPIGPLISAALAGGWLAGGFTTIGVCDYNPLEPPFTCPVDPFFNNLPLVALNRDANDLENLAFGPDGDDCMAPGPFGPVECGGGGGGFFAGIPGGPPNTHMALGEFLTPQQEALLGCGPMFGIQCDNQGIDLMNSDASVAFQSFVGFEGTYCQSDDKTLCWLTGDVEYDPATGVVTSVGGVAAQPGTLNFLTGEEGLSPGEGQILGGPVATRYDRKQQRAGMLPGAARTVIPVLGLPPGDPVVLNPNWDPAIDGCTQLQANMPAGPRKVFCDGSIPGAAALGVPGILSLDHPFAIDLATGQPQQFASELAALSWNLMVLLATVDGKFSIVDRYKAGGCSWTTPQNCPTIRQLMGVSGLTRNIAKAGGNEKFGRRTFLWHGGGEVNLAYLKRNILGVAVDFAEDTTKTNWAFEFAWINKVRLADSDSFVGYTDVQDFNLSVSIDRPTFVRFLNSSRTFFMNMQLFLQYRDGYKNSMPSEGPVNFLFTFAVQTGYMQDRLLPSFIFVYDVQSQSGATIPQVTYRVSSNFSLNFGVSFFWGSASYFPMPLSNLVIGNRGGARPYENATYNGLGIIRDRDEIFFRLRYTF